MDDDGDAKIRRNFVVFSAATTAAWWLDLPNGIIANALSQSLYKQDGRFDAARLIWLSLFVFAYLAHRYLSTGCFRKAKLKVRSLWSEAVRDRLNAFADCETAADGSVTMKTERLRPDVVNLVNQMTASLPPGTLSELRGSSWPEVAVVLERFKFQGNPRKHEYVVGFIQPQVPEAFDPMEPDHSRKGRLSVTSSDRLYVELSWDEDAAVTLHSVRLAFWRAVLDDSFSEHLIPLLLGASALASMIWRLAQ